MGASTDDNNEIRVGPVEAESAADVLARLERQKMQIADWLEEGDELPELPPNRRHTFTLRQLLLLMTGLCVWLGIVRGLSGWSMPLMTGFTGLVALVGLFALSSREDSPAIVRVAWWVLLVVYLTSAVVTVLSG